MNKDLTKRLEEIGITREKILKLISTDRKVGGSFGFVQPEAEFSVNLTNMKSVKVF